MYLKIRRKVDLKNAKTKPETLKDFLSHSLPMSASKGRRRSFLMNDVSEVNILLNNAWDQDQKFELWMRPRPKIWTISETNTKSWTMLETETENLSNQKKTTPKLPEVIPADREGKSSSKDLFRPLKRRRTRKMKTTTIIQGAEPFGGSIQIHSDPINCRGYPIAKSQNPCICLKLNTWNSNQI